jgi:hypothetical protein
MMAKKADEKKKELEKAVNFYNADPSEREEAKKNTPLESKEKEKTVIGLIEAEKLQKAGWVLVDAHLVSDDPFGDKEYKFRKDN